MKKILIALFLITTLVLSSTLIVSAEHYWNDTINFTAAYGTVNVDGKIDAGEWDNAQAVDIKLNNDSLAAKGFVNYQGEWDGDRNDSDFSGTYKVKWDENYIYFLEDRNDDHVNLSGDATEPYLTDGTLVFTQVDSADGKINPDGISVHAFYTVGLEGKIGGDLKARVCNMEEATRETVDIPGGKVASTIKSGGFIIEVAIPWSFYTSYIPSFKTQAAGDKMGISYVVHDSDADDTGYVKQLCYAVDNDNLGDVPGGYDFGGWGTLELLAAPVAPVVVEEPAPVAETTPDTPAIVETPVAPVVAPAPAPAPAPTAPATGDGNDTIILFAVMILAAGAFAISRRLIKVK